VWRGPGPRRSSPATPTSAPGGRCASGVIESTFEPLAIDAVVAREGGRLPAAIRRALDLAVAATANVHDVPLLTLNAADSG